MTSERTQIQNDLHQEDDVQIDKKVQNISDSNHHNGTSFISQASSSSQLINDNNQSINSVEETNSNNKSSYHSSGNTSSQEEGGSGDDGLPSTSSMDHDEYEFHDPDPVPVINNDNLYYDRDEYLVAQEFVERINSDSRVDIDRILDGADVLLQNVAEEIRSYRDEAIALLNYPRERYLDYVQLHNEIENAPIPVEALSDLGEEISGDDDEYWDTEGCSCPVSQIEMAGDPGPYYDRFRREHQQVEQHRMYINGQIEPEAANSINDNNHQTNAQNENDNLSFVPVIPSNRSYSPSQPHADSSQEHSSSHEPNDSHSKS